MSILRDLDELTPLEKLGLINMSYSRMNTFETCQAKYYYTYIQKESRIFGPAATMGTVVHTTLEQTDLNQLEINAMIARLESEFEVEDPDDLVNEELRTAARTIVQEFVDRHDGEYFDVIQKEYPFNVVVGNGYFKGYIDRIDKTPSGGALIQDYKAQPLDAHVVTPLGTKKMEELSVGDEVTGSNGKPTRVVGVYPQGVIGAYRVTFSDESSTVCSKDHLWKIYTEEKSETLPLHKIIEGMNQGNKYSIPVVEPVEYKPSSQIKLRVHPYSLGILLGSNEDVDAVDVIERYGNRFYAQLDKLGLKNIGAKDKFIPPEYLKASIGERKELLRGIMDANVSFSVRNTFTTIAENMRDGMIELCRSLGAISTSVTDDFSHSVSVTTSFDPYFRRKIQMNWTMPADPLRKTITSVDKIDDAEMQCIKVDDENGLYVTDDFIVTHNTGKWQVAKKNIPHDLQLGLYAVVARKFFPDLWPIRGELYYLRSGKQLGHTYTHEELDLMEHKILQMTKQIALKDNFAYTQNSWTCKKMCDFGKTGACPRGKTVLGNW
jgi:hypothetical protein